MHYYCCLCCDGVSPICVSECLIYASPWQTHTLSTIQTTNQPHLWANGHSNLHPQTNVQRLAYISFVFSSETCVLTHCLAFNRVTFLANRKDRKNQSHQIKKRETKFHSVANQPTQLVGQLFFAPNEWVYGADCVSMVIIIVLYHNETSRFHHPLPICRKMFSNFTAKLIHAQVYHFHGLHSV